MKLILRDLRILKEISKSLISIEIKVYYAITYVGKSLLEGKEDNMSSYIEQAKVMSKGQITLPKEIRKLLGLNVGDRVSFIVNGNQVILANSSICVLKLIQKDFEGEAANASLRNEEDVQKLLEENR